VLHALSPFLVAEAKARTYQVSLLLMGALAVPSIIPVLAMTDDRRPDTAIRMLPPTWVAMGAWLRQGIVQARATAQGIIGRFSVTQALVGFGAGMFFPFVNLYVVNQLGGTPRLFGALSAAYTISLVVAALVSAPLAGRLGRIRLSVAAQLCSLPFLLVMGIVPVLWVVAGGYLMRGFLMGLPNAPLQAYLMESVPEQTRVVASSVYNVSFQVAGAAGSGVGGLIILHAGNQASFFVAAPFYAASALLLAFWFGGRAKGTGAAGGRSAA
jgi:MFS family permease